MAQFNAGDRVLVIDGDPYTLGEKRVLVSRHVHPDTLAPGWRLDQPLHTSDGRSCNSVAEHCIIKVGDKSAKTVLPQEANPAPAPAH